MRKLVLFDIDGTLLWTDGAGRRAIRRALLEEMGTAGPIDGYRFDGKTDPQIIQELLTEANHPDACRRERHESVWRKYVELLAEELGSSPGRAKLYSGVEELLRRLEERGDVLVGLLTGNLAAGAELKLRAAGLDPSRFRVGAFGSDAAERWRLPAIAVRRAATLMGRTVRGEDLVIVGDTPADITCGRELDARAIGVATGAFSVRDLLEAGAFAAFESFAHPEPVISAICA